MAKLFLKIIPKNISDFFTNSAHLATHLLLLLLFFLIQKSQIIFFILTNNFLHFYITLTLYQLSTYSFFFSPLKKFVKHPNSNIVYLYPTPKQINSYFKLDKINYKFPHGMLYIICFFFRFTFFFHFLS